MEEIDERNLTNRTRKERAKSDKTLMRTNNVKPRFVMGALGFTARIPDFAQKETQSFPCWKIESV
jgi:hypothetical protein